MNPFQILPAPLRRWALVMALVLLALPSLRADLTQQQVAEAKAATGLLLTPEGSGTAFCISDSGLFVTCKHVLDGAKEDSITIVLSPTGKDEKKYPAKIVRRLNDDLAILKVVLDRKVPVLKLGDVAALFETQQLYAFGYPFGKDLAEDAKSYPSISVNVGRVTALRKKKEALDAIQFDAQVNPGNSGGPVLDGNGNVVGVVEAGVIATGINFAVPISILREEMTAPIVTTTLSNTYPQLPSKPVEFIVSVDWLTPPPTEPQVAVEIRREGKSQRIAAIKNKEGNYQAQYATVAETGKGEKVKLRVTLAFESGKMAGTIADREISIGGKPKALREIHTLQRQLNRKDFLADGDPAGDLAELKALTLDMGGATITVDARNASRIEIEAPSTEVPNFSYKAVVKLADGKEFSSDEKALNAATTASIAASSRPVNISPAAKGPSPVHEYVPPPPSLISPAPKTPSPVHEIVPPPPILNGKVTLAGTQETALPNAISEVLSAQDGRSLLLYMKDAKQIAVFDVIGLKIRGYINLGVSDAMIAAGAKYVIAICPGSNVVQRFSLETLQRDRTISNPFGNVLSVTMGRSSPGLALVTTAANQGSPWPGIYAFDAQSMTIATTAEKQMGTHLHACIPIVRASADGRTFAIFRQGISPSGFLLLNYRDGEFVVTYEHVTCGVLVPNADGSQIFTSESGVYTNKYVSVLQSHGNWSQGVAYIPSYHPMYFLGVPYEAEHAGLNKKKSTNSISIYWTSANQPLFKAPQEYQELQAVRTEPGVHDPITLDQRYHFFPQLNLFLTIPPTNNKVIARSFNIRQLLDEKGIDYLYVTSSAPLGRVSALYRYTLEAASRAGGVTFALQSGPKGLTISNQGEVKWKTPAQPMDETVIVSLKDKSGQELLHTFHVTTAP